MSRILCPSPGREHEGSHEAGGLGRVCANRSDYVPPVYRGSRFLLALIGTTGMSLEV